MLKELVLNNRSYRRFDEGRRMEPSELVELVDLARLTPSTANLQALRYIISADASRNKTIFRTLKWAGYLKEWPGPFDGERPTGYIVILQDRRISKARSCDHGIAAQTILLGAVEKGLGGCMIGNLDEKALGDALGIEDHLEILLVVALGLPVEEIRLEPVGPGGDVKYWRDEKGVHHVPKRSLKEIIIKR